MAAAAAVLFEDDRGIPRSLLLLAAFVKAEARHCAFAASRPAETDLVRAFRGGAVPKVSIRVFLERIHLMTLSVPSTEGMIDGTCFVLARIYVNRFNRSPAGREAGILVNPTTAHRLVAVAIFLGAKFGCHPPRRWTAVFEVCSEGVIRAGEMEDLEGLFLRAIDFRLFVHGDEFKWFCLVLERGHSAASSGGGHACKKRIGSHLPPPSVQSNFYLKLRIQFAYYFFWFWLNLIVHLCCAIGKSASGEDGNHRLISCLSPGPDWSYLSVFLATVISMEQFTVPKVFEVNRKGVIL